MKWQTVVGWGREWPSHPFAHGAFFGVTSALWFAVLAWWWPDTELGFWVATFGVTLVWDILTRWGQR